MSEHFSIEHLRRIYVPWTRRSSDTTCPYFSSNLRRCLHAIQRNYDPSLESVAISAAAVGTVDDETCPVVMHLMEEDGLRQFPAMKLLELVRVELAFGTARQHMFTRTNHDANRDQLAGPQVDAHSTRNTWQYQQRIVSWAVY